MRFVTYTHQAKEFHGNTTALQHNNGVRQQRMGRFVDRIALQSQRLCQIQLLVKCLYYRISREKSVAVLIRCSVFLNLMRMGQVSRRCDFHIARSRLI